MTGPIGRVVVRIRVVDIPPAVVVVIGALLPIRARMSDVALLSFPLRSPSRTLFPSPCVRPPLLALALLFLLIDIGPSRRPASLFVVFLVVFVFSFKVDLGCLEDDERFQLGREVPETGERPGRFGGTGADCGRLGRGSGRVSCL